MSKKRKTEGSKTVTIDAGTQKDALKKARIYNPGWVPIVTQVRTKYTVYEVTMRKKNLGGKK